MDDATNIDEGNLRNCVKGDFIALQVRTLPQIAILCWRMNSGAVTSPGGHAANDRTEQNYDTLEVKDGDVKRLDVSLFITTTL